jgi:hypothetical protein
VQSAIFEIPLSSSPCRATSVRLREPNASVELLPNGTGPVAVTEMIAMLLLEGPSRRLGPDDVWNLSIGDRDRIVALLHAHCFGDRIEGLVHCGACGGEFEVRFPLAEVMVVRDPQQARRADDGSKGQGMYLLADSGRFRLPTTDDERILADLPPEQVARELARRCIVSDGPTTDIEAFERAMEQIAPTVNVDVPVDCAVCGAKQKVPFDIVSFFVSSLARERTILLREMHCLAAVYHWSWAEIAALPRSIRRAHVRLIGAERAVRRGVS